MKLIKMMGHFQVVGLDCKVATNLKSSNERVAL